MEIFNDMGVSKFKKYSFWKWTTPLTRKRTALQWENYQLICRKSSANRLETSTEEHLLATNSTETTATSRHAVRVNRSSFCYAYHFSCQLDSWIAKYPKYFPQYVLNSPGASIKIEACTNPAYTAQQRPVLFKCVCVAGVRRRLHSDRSKD